MEWNTNKQAKASRKRRKMINISIFKILVCISLLTTSATNFVCLSGIDMKSMIKSFVYRIAARSDKKNVLCVLN